MTVAVTDVDAVADVDADTKIHTVILLLCYSLFHRQLDVVL